MRPSFIRRLIPLAVAFAAIRMAAHPETAEARAELDKLITEFPKEAELYVRRAALRVEHEEWTFAETDLRRAQTLEPRSPRVIRGLGALNLARGWFPAAKKYFDTALDLEPRNAETLVLRARANAALGETEAAEADYVAALRLLTSPSPDLYLARAALPVAPARALAAIDEGLARIGPAAPLLERALALELTLGRTDAALQRLDALAATAERKETFLKRRGDILTGAGRAGEARAAYEAALVAIAALPEWLQESPATAQLRTELRRLAGHSH
jgi:predicted Zn-dependent protease